MFTPTFTDPEHTEILFMEPDLERGGDKLTSTQITVSGFRSDIDDVKVIQIDTAAAESGQVSTGRIRISLNDGPPVYDGDPEVDENLASKFTALISDEGTVYTPFIDRPANGMQITIGLKVKLPDGRNKVVYLVPSGSSDGALGDVFVYEGDDTDGEPFTYVVWKEGEA